MFPCARSYRLATVSQLTHCSNCSAYNISTRTTQKTPFLLLFPIVSVQTCLFAKPLLSNCFCGFLIFRGRCPATGLHVTVSSGMWQHRVSHRFIHIYVGHIDISKEHTSGAVSSSEMSAIFYQLHGVPELLIIMDGHRHLNLKTSHGFFRK
jgi:hypothetical protein